MKVIRYYQEDFNGMGRIVEFLESEWLNVAERNSVEMKNRTGIEVQIKSNGSIKSFTVVHPYKFREWLETEVDAGELDYGHILIGMDGTGFEANPPKTEEQRLREEKEAEEEMNRKILKSFGIDPDTPENRQEEAIWDHFKKEYGTEGVNK